MEMTEANREFISNGVEEIIRTGGKDNKKTLKIILGIAIVVLLSISGASLYFSTSEQEAITDLVGEFSGIDTTTIFSRPALNATGLMMGESGNYYLDNVLVARWSEADDAYKINVTALFASKVRELTASVVTARAMSSSSS